MTATAPPPKPTRSVAHFSITGEFITRHARELWAERKFEKALKTLECIMGSTREHHEQLLAGKIQFVGVNDLTLAEDDWQPPKDYPTLYQALSQGSAFEELLQRREDEAVECLKRAADLQVNGDTGLDATQALRCQRRAIDLIGSERTDEMLAAFVEEAEAEQRTTARRSNLLDPLAIAAHGAQQRMIMMGLGGSLPTIDALLHRGTNIAPKVCHDMSSPCGWLLPDGKYYACGQMEHVGLAETLMAGKIVPGKGDAERTAEMLGWIKISSGMIGTYVVGQKPPTKRQQSKLWDYAERHGLDYQKITASLPSDD